jgi:transposase
VHGYPHPERLPETVAVFQAEAVQLAGLLLEELRANQEAKRPLKTLFDQHPDAPLFASLPGAGDLLALALLAKFGDDRQRFPTAASVQALTGTCPVTVFSGKRGSVNFRFS